jgi:hypothetical protein
MHKKTDVILVIFGVILGTVASLSLLSPNCRNCPLRSFLGIGLMLDMSFFGTCGLCTMSWILFSEKLYLMTLCAYLVLSKVKKTIGGSRWKLRELTRVNRFLAYLTCPHEWSIRSKKGSHKSNGNRLMGLFKGVVSVSVL